VTDAGARYFTPAPGLATPKRCCARTIAARACRYSVGDTVPRMRICSRRAAALLAWARSLTGSARRAGSANCPVGIARRWRVVSLASATARMRRVRGAAAI
jgi:hypothetical protein